MFAQYFPTLNLVIQAMRDVHMCFSLLYEKNRYHKLFGGIPEIIRLHDVTWIDDSVICIQWDPNFVTKIWSKCPEILDQIIIFMPGLSCQINTFPGVHTCELSFAYLNHSSIGVHNTSKYQLGFISPEVHGHFIILAYHPSSYWIIVWMEPHYSCPITTYKMIKVRFPWNPRTTHCYSPVTPHSWGGCDTSLSSHKILDVVVHLISWPSFWKVHTIPIYWKGFYMYYLATFSEKWKKPTREKPQKISMLPSLGE